MIAVAPYVARIMRASMIEVLESDYVEMARLKGLPERTVLIRHALPNAIGPVFQVIAISLAYLAGGIVVVEYVFNYPGIGSALQEAVVNHDIPVVQALAMLIAAHLRRLNLLADVATILVTPRAEDAAVSRADPHRARRRASHRDAPGPRDVAAAPHRCGCGAPGSAGLFVASWSCSRSSARSSRPTARRSPSASQTRRPAGQRLCSAPTTSGRTSGAGSSTAGSHILIMAVDRDRGRPHRRRGRSAWSRRTRGTRSTTS